MNIHWYPGHMAKTRRMMLEMLPLCDIVCEIIDARIPRSSRNPDLFELTASKPRLVILNRADLADEAATKLWEQHFSGLGFSVLRTDSRSGAGVSAFPGAVRRALKEKLERYAQQGQAGRGIKAMIIGVPNVGKSSFINRVAGRKTAKAQDRPGVTRGRQWITVERGFELLDTPGMLWPKIESQDVALNLAFTGAVRDETMDAESLAALLCERLAARCPAAFAARFKIKEDLASPGHALLTSAARGRGFLISGGEADTERASAVILDEFRAGLLGRITLEMPDGGETAATAL